MKEFLHIPIDQIDKFQIVLNETKTLDHHKTLSENGICNIANITLVPKLRSGNQSYKKCKRRRKKKLQETISHRLPHPQKLHQKKLVKVFVRINAKATQVIYVRPNDRVKQTIQRKLCIPKWVMKNAYVTRNGRAINGDTSFIRNHVQDNDNI